MRVRPSSSNRRRPTSGSWSAPTRPPLLGLPTRLEPESDRALLAERDANFATVQEHYYADPPRIERGWREHFVDTDGQTYLDMVNNVATTGHGHPRLVEAVSRQWARLNTNSRFHYAAVAEFSARLAALAPDPLDTVFLVNSGSEAVDLALRLATTATARPTMLAMREAYHGWTIGSDAVSSSIGDNPRALETRPDWVRLVDAPNTFRGTHRGADSGPSVPRRPGSRSWPASTPTGVEIAGFIAEAVYGNAGGVLLPDGYLAGVYERVRARGGLCIADEVQVGYGRLGEHFWGFEQQGVVPDVITIAKAMGNGHPLGAVITTRAIADAFAAEGSMFSSAGGSPVSCVVGMAVLDILEDEGLQENARVVGGALRAGLEELATRHELIGAVHGLGLYLGVELVRSRETLRACHRRDRGDLRRAPARGRHHAADRRPQERAEDQTADAAHARERRLLRGRTRPRARRAILLASGLHTVGIAPVTMPTSCSFDTSEVRVPPTTLPPRITHTWSVSRFTCSKLCETTSTV